LGLRFQGHLPLEEALFFFLTVVMSAQGFVMLAAHFRPRPQGKTGRMNTTQSRTARPRVRTGLETWSRQDFQGAGRQARWAGHEPDGRFAGRALDD
jgi:hypothetical protein